jgi:tetraacyldisaccharide 4'-kinase
VLGDEPFSILKKFKNIPLMPIGRTGSNNYFRAKPVILLDDAYQHRKVKAVYIFCLLRELYCDDFILPTGNLRESKSASYYYYRDKMPFKPIISGAKQH